MPEKKSIDSFEYNRVKAVMKTLNLDQALLAEKLNLTQASVSKALNGANEKTFQRIVGLLQQEYGIQSLDEHLESAVGKDIDLIKKDLNEIKESLLRLEIDLKEIKKVLKQ